MTNLWPEDLTVVTAKPPSTILKEQAYLLGQQTQNIIKADVRQQTSFVDTKQFNYAFDIIAPALENYRYQLFTFSHAVTLYPITVTLDADIAAEINKTKGIKVQSEPEFMEVLSKIFQSKKTWQIIQVLLAQSQDYEPDPEIPF